MTLNEIIYDIREKLKLSTDDIDITDEYLAHLINIKRNLLIKQRYAKFTKTVPEETKQIICVPLEEVDKFDDTCIGFILRSVNKLPTLMQLDNKPALISVSTYDLRLLPMSIVAIERFPYLGHNRWTRGQLFVGLDSDGRIYFQSVRDEHRLLENVKLTAVFEDPEEADAAACEDADNTCEYFEKPYSVEAHMVHDIVNMIIKELAPGLQIPEDKQNNADESPR